MGMVVRRFDRFAFETDSPIRAVVRKLYLCVVVSPDEMNQSLSTVIIAPMTTKGREYPTRVACSFEGKQGQIVLDQIRTVDKRRLIKHLGELQPDEQSAVLAVLAEMFVD